MSILQKIKEDKTKARKEGNKFVLQVLTTAQGEIDRVVTMDPKANQIKPLQKIVSGIREAISLRGDSDGSLGKEISVLESYIPKEMTKEEVLEFIKKTEGIPEGKAGIGFVVKSLKSSGLHADSKVVASCF